MALPESRPGDLATMSLLKDGGSQTGSRKHHGIHGVCDRKFQLGDCVTVRAPATSANIGCGFDAFGIALDMWLTLKVTVCEQFSCVISGPETDESIPMDSSNVIVLSFMVGIRHLHAQPHCLRHTTSATGSGPTPGAGMEEGGTGGHLGGHNGGHTGGHSGGHTGGHSGADGCGSIHPHSGLTGCGIPSSGCGLNFSFECQNAIPVSRGLGSSAAAIVAGLGAAFALCGKDLSDRQVLEDLAVLACRREGHPDNVMPAIFGSMQIGVEKTNADIRLSVESSFGDYIIQSIPFPSDDIVCIVFVPEEKLSTSEARKMLPDQVSRFDASQNIARAGILVAALTLRDYSNIRFALEDRLHQPYRLKICPSFQALRHAFPATEALAMYLSGAGPSTVILSRFENEKEIVAELQQICANFLCGRFETVRVSPFGIHVSYSNFASLIK